MGAPKLELTPALVKGLTFDRMITGINKLGRPTLGPTPPDTHDWIVRDTVVSGLFLRLTRGASTWYVQRKMGGKRTVRAMGHLWLGEGAETTLTLEQARKRAQIWLGLMAQGIDPLRVKKKQLEDNAKSSLRQSLTLGVSFQDYMDKTRQKAAKSTTEDREKVKRWMERSPMWPVPIEKLDRDHVEASLGPLLAYLHGHVKARPSWGPRSLSPGTFNKIYAWSAQAWRRGAGQLGLPNSRGEGPFALWKADQAWPKAKMKTSEVLLDPDTLDGKAWLKALVELQAKAHDPGLLTNRPDPRTKGIKPHTGVLVDFFVLVLLWGTRKTETSLLKWDQVDFRKRIVLLHPETTKSGALGAVPMTDWAEEILHKRREFNDRWRPDEPSPYVFPSRVRGKAVASPNGILVALEKQTGLKVRAHDLRHTVATEVGSQADLQRAASLALASAALHHAKGRGLIGGATALYVHRQAEALRDLFQRREDRLRSVVGLPVNRKAAEASSLDEFLDLAANDPEVQRMFFERMAAKKINAT
jgi:integrase